MTLDNFKFDSKALELLKTSIQELNEFEFDPQNIITRGLADAPLVRDHLEKITESWLNLRVYREETESIESANFARRISHGIYPQLIKVIAEYHDVYAPLVKYLSASDPQIMREADFIKKYKAYLMGLPFQPIFDETFALQDIYVDLESTDEYKTTGQLMRTVLDQLEDRSHVIFVKAGPGKGKSVFSQMLAAKVANQYPDWIPMLIRLGDERFVLGDYIDDSIKNYIKNHFILSEELLHDRRFLFILDGFDELWLSSEKSYSLRFFFDQLAAFQKHCQKSQWRHKIVVTGRPMRIQNIQVELPDNFKQFEIKDLNDENMDQWINNWSKLSVEGVGDEFKHFLHVQASDEIKKLAREPLFVYMLAAMHRDKALGPIETEDSQKIKIFDRAICWACGEQRYGEFHRSTRIFENYNVKPAELRELLRETAICIWQGGKEHAPIDRIQKRLMDRSAKKFKSLFDSDLEGVHNILASFYFKRHEKGKGNVEFSHKLFGEYLAAEKMVNTLWEIGERSPNEMPDRDLYRIENIRHVASLFYSVFASRLVTDQVNEFVKEILADRIQSASSGDIDFLTERLYELYIEFSNGRWFDEGITRIAWDEIKQFDVNVSLLNFEAQTIINLFLMLCHLYKIKGKSLCICGENDLFDENRLRKLVGLGETIAPLSLVSTIHGSWPKVNLSKANLRGLYLTQTDLRGANLRGSNLQYANLREVDLRNADLRGSALDNACFEGANLEYTRIRRDQRERYRDIFSFDQTKKQISWV